MKKVILAVGIIMLTASMSFAYGEAKDEGMAATSAKATTVSGTVSSVIPADSAKGMEAWLSLMDEEGKQEKIMVPQSAKIMDVNNNSITFSQIKATNKVKVDFKQTAAGEKEATAIHLES